MIEVLRYSASSLFWGALIALLCLGLFFALIKGWWKDAKFTLSSYLIGFGLGLVLLYQSCLMCYSFVILRVADDCEPVLTDIISQCSDQADAVMTPEQSDEIIKKFALQNPLVAHYIDVKKYEGCTARQLPHAIVQDIKSYRRWFIFRRILWSLGWSILAAVLVIKTMSRQYLSHDRYSRSERPRVSRSDRTRVSRRRR